MLSHLRPAIVSMGLFTVLLLSLIHIWTPHPTHAHVDLALEWIAKAKPRRAILTNLHIDLDYHVLSARLPSGVEAAYDGMRFIL